MKEHKPPISGSVDFESLDRPSQERLLGAAEARTLEQLRVWVRENQERITYETGRLYRYVVVVLVISLGAVVALGYTWVRGVEQKVGLKLDQFLGEVESARTKVNRLHEEGVTLLDKVRASEDSATKDVAKLEQMLATAVTQEKEFHSIVQRVGTLEMRLKDVVAAGDELKRIRGTLDDLKDANARATRLLEELKRENPKGKQGKPTPETSP